MSVVLLLIGDGRDEIHDRAWQSAEENLPAGICDRRLVIDDRDHELGFAGAIQEGWRQVVETDAHYVFHLEADFLFIAPPPLERMIHVLEEHPYLVQIALKRNAVNEAERRAGGIVELRPDTFEQKVEHGDIWTEHRNFFTTNPSIYPASLCTQGWPQEAESEGKFGLRLFEDPAARSAFWGAKFDPPRVLHIGDTRAGHGY